VANTKHHQILIVGGGTAGVTVAASLHRRGPGSLDIAIVEPSEIHYYQPCFTLVGAGAYDMAKSQRPERSLIAAGVTFIHGAAKAFDPDKNSVVLETGDALTYDYLVVCTGVKLDWDKIEGLSATLGKNSVCSNYSPLYAPYTWQCVQGLKPGSRAVFTQPPLPFKCPGAPQKIVYLTADRLRRAGALQACDLQYFVHAPVVFGVPFFARELMKVVALRDQGIFPAKPRGGRRCGEDRDIRGRGRRRQGKAYDSYVRHVARFASAKPARRDQEKPVG
jgi:sulfide:quinone oxidoreductase